MLCLFQLFAELFVSFISSAPQAFCIINTAEGKKRKTGAKRWARVVSAGFGLSLIESGINFAKQSQSEVMQTKANELETDWCAVSVVAIGELKSELQKKKISL